jgi:hypothetical protein
LRRLWDPGGENHLAHASNDLRWPGISEPSVVDEAAWQSPWSCPSPHGLRQVAMSDVDVKLPIAANFEQGHLAVVSGARG